MAGHNGPWAKKIDQPPVSHDQLSQLISAEEIKAVFDEAGIVINFDIEGEVPDAEKELAKETFEANYIRNIKSVLDEYVKELVIFSHPNIDVRDDYRQHARGHALVELTSTISMQRVPIDPDILKMLSDPNTMDEALNMMVTEKKLPMPKMPREFEDAATIAETLLATVEEQLTQQGFRFTSENIEIT